MKKYSYKEWINESEKNKLLAIKLIMIDWTLTGRITRVEPEWFYKALTTSYHECEPDAKIDETMLLLAIGGNAIINKQRDETIKQLLSKLTNYDKKIYESVEIELYKKSKYGGEKDFIIAIDNVASEVDKTHDEVLSHWNKVDRALIGVK